MSLADVMDVKKRILILLLTWSVGAEANFVGNDTSNFNPTHSGLGFVTVHDSETLSEGVLNFGLFLNQAGNLLPTTVDSSGQAIDSKDRLTFADLSLAYGLMNRLDLGISFSYLVNQETNRSASGAQFSATGLNSIRLTSKYTLINRDPIGLAFILSSNLNTTYQNPFMGNNAGPTFNFETALDYKLKDILFGFNLGYRKRSPGQTIPNSLFKPLGDEVIASTGVSYYSTKIDTKFISEVIIAKAVNSTNYIQSSTVSSEVIAGAKWDYNHSTALHAGAGTRLSDGLFSPDWRIYVGLNYDMDLLGGKKLTAVPAPTINLKHIHGYLPEDIESLINVPFDEIATNHEFNLRKDIPPSDFKGLKPPFEIIRLNDFSFDFGSAVIKKELYSDLDRLVEYLKAEPGVLKMRIEGHTDSIGSVSRNKQVSQMRANAIKSYLDSKGLKDKFLMEPVGFGSERPIGDNGNFQGRMQNRRVEFRILRRLSPTPQRIQ